jgi:hypothetical protein
MTCNLALTTAACLLAATLSGALCLAADWPPTLDAKNQTTQALDGRTIERYTHGPRPEWGYPPAAAGEWNYHAAQETGATQQNHNSFYLVTPVSPQPNTPLCVILHSANRTAYDYLGFACLNRKIDGGDDPATTMTNPPADFYALFLNSTNEEWWGWGQCHQNAAHGLNTPPPAELRVLDTIEWVVNKCNIDRNRIYLCGVSMGGCGTLGLGIPHGEIFAAIRAQVPAGTGYASYRRGGFAPSPAWDATQSERDAWLQRAAGVGLPDPPVLVDFSSEMDTWATTEPALVQAAVAGRFPLVLTWGMFGHCTFGSIIAKTPICQVGLAFPWTEIRKNEAYPVFTHATCDQRCPWLNAPPDYDGAGQMNAYFRWKSVEDTPTRLIMQLWLAQPTITGPAPGQPREATADVTLRRLQQLPLRPHTTYTWQLTLAGKVVQSGHVSPDAVNLLTIPHLKITTAPSELTVQLGP